MIKNIFIISLAVTIVAFIIHLILTLIYGDKRIRKKIYSQISMLDILGFIISISGAIGIGKTTSGYGITHLFTIKFNNDIKKQLKIIKLKNYKVDFTKLDERLFKEYQCFFVYDIKTRKQLPQLIIADNQRPHLMVFERVKGDYKDFLELLDYIYLIYKLFLKRFVMSNNRIKNYLTNNYAKYLNECDFNLKDTKESKDFALDKYVATFLDEQLLTNINLNQKDRNKEDNGKREFLRLIRHLFEEKLFFISTEQNFLRVDKDLRELYNSNLHVYKRKIIITKKLRYSLYKFLNKIIETLITIGLLVKTQSLRSSKDLFIFSGDKINKMYSQADRLFYRKGKYAVTKRLILWLYKRQINIIETSLVKYYFILNEIDNKGDPIPVKKIKLTFYYEWCFKSGDSHYYKFISEVLKNEAIINFDTAPTHDYALTKEEKIDKTTKILKKKPLKK